MTQLRITNVVKHVRVTWDNGEPFNVSIPVRIDATLASGAVDVPVVVPGAPEAQTAPTISNPTPAPGETVTITAGSYSNDPLVAESLTLGGFAVSMVLPGRTYTIPAGASQGLLLVYSEVASNGTPPNETQSAQATVTVAPAQLAVSGAPSSAQANAGAAYSFTPTITGGVAPYTVALAAGALPTGLSVNPTTGRVSGTLQELGDFDGLVLRVTDNVGSTVDLAAFDIEVVSNLDISGTPLMAAEVGDAYSFVPTVVGGVAPLVFSLEAGTLPSGTGFNPATGAVSGTLTTAQTASGILIRVTDDIGSVDDLPAFNVVIAADGSGMTPAEADAFVAAKKAEADPMAHTDPSDMVRMQEHMTMMALVPRPDATHTAITDGITGNWTDPATWHNGLVPDANARVFIPDTCSVIYNSSSTDSLFNMRVDGNLMWQNDIDTFLEIDTLVCPPGGLVQIGTEAAPIAAGVTAHVRIANNGPIDVNYDPTLLSRGIIFHGTTVIWGATKTPFVKVNTATGPTAGATSMTLASAPTGWRVGDQIVLTGTHKKSFTWNGTAQVHVPSEDEELTITNIVGSVVNFTPALTYSHEAPRADLRAYVANLTRNVLVDSLAATVAHRGHTMFMHSNNVNVNYAQFTRLGRTDKSIEARDGSAFATIVFDTNVKGRYAVHFHRCGTADQDNPGICDGCVVNIGAGWGFTHHSSHAMFTDGVAFDIYGACWAAEDGDETGVWSGNIGIKTEGRGYGEASVKEISTLEWHDNGHSGDCYFFAGRHVECHSNVSANCTHGYTWMPRSAPARLLAANLSYPYLAYGQTTINPDNPVINGFRDNEVFCAAVGMIVNKANPSQQHDQRTVMHRLLGWELSYGQEMAYTAHYTMIDFDLLGTYSTEPIASREDGISILTNSLDMVWVNPVVENFVIGINFTATFTFPIGPGDVDHLIVNDTLINCATDYEAFDATRHRIIETADLTADALSFAMTGDLTISEGETLVLSGNKTDSTGTRARQMSGAPQELLFNEMIAGLIASDGYYETVGGSYYLLVRDLVAGRDDGEVLEITHTVVLDMTLSQINNNFFINDVFGGAVYNGVDGVSNSVPVIDGPPVIAGSAVEGAVLSATLDSISGVPTPTGSVQWFRDGGPNVGTNSLNYTIGAADVGNRLGIRHLATNAEGTTTETSALTAVVTAASSGSDDTLTFNSMVFDEGTDGNFPTLAADYFYDGSDDVIIQGVTSTSATAPSQGDIDTGTGTGSLEAFTGVISNGVLTITNGITSASEPAAYIHAYLREGGGGADVSATLSFGDGSNLGIDATVAAPDTTDPTLSSTTPADDATAVVVGSDIVMVFDENIAFGTGNITLRSNDGGWADVEVFDVVADAGTGAGTVGISGAVLTINPTADLDNSIEYAIRIDSTAIDDSAGNSYAGIADDTTVSFTSEAAAASSTPATILGANEIFTLDVSAGGLFQDNAVTAADTAGDLVDYIPDQSGGAAVRSVGGALRPAYRVDGNSNPYLEFSDHVLTRALSRSGNFYAIVAMDSAEATIDTILRLITLRADASTWWAGDRLTLSYTGYSSPVELQAEHSAGNASVNFDMPSGPFVIEFWFDGVNAGISIDGGTDVTLDITAAAPTTAHVDIGRSIDGGGFTANEDPQFDLYGLAFADTIPNGTQRGDLRTWAAALNGATV